MSARAPLALGNAGEAQSLQIVFAVALVFDRINLGEPLHGEIGLERQELVDVRLRLLRPPEMPERGEQRLVGVDETGTDFRNATAGFHRSFIVASKCVRERINVLRPNIIWMGRRQIMELL